MDVANATHLRWRQIQTDPKKMENYGRTVDDIWFVQHRHGPFGPRGGNEGQPKARRKQERWSSVTHDVRSGQFWDVASGTAPPPWASAAAPVPGGGHDSW